MWDVVVTVTLMGFGAFTVITFGVILILVLHVLQNGDGDD